VAGSCMILSDMFVESIVACVDCALFPHTSEPNGTDREMARNASQYCTT
jgi:hypothetical protein